MPSIRVLARACVLAAVFLAGRPVAAQTESTRGPTAQPSNAEMNARRLFEAGRAAYEERRYEDALAYFEQAYELSGRQALLYNVGVSAERLGRRERAIEAFEGYLAHVPDAPNRAEVEGRLGVLRRVPTPEPEPEVSPIAPVETAAPVAPTAPATAAPEPSRGPLPTVLLVSGGAVAAGGVVLVGFGRRNYNEVEGATLGATWAEFKDQWGRGHTLAVAGYAALGVGAAAATVGIVLFAMRGSDDGVETSAGLPSLQVALAPNGLFLSGRFR